MESKAYKGRILTAADGEEYNKALERNSPLSVLPAKFILQPSSYSDIPPIFTYARSQNPPLEIAVKGGGIHTSTWASSDKGLVIDSAEQNHSINLYGCKGVVLQIKGKVNAVTMGEQRLEYSNELR